MIKLNKIQINSVSEISSEDAILEILKENSVELVIQFISKSVGIDDIFYALSNLSQDEN